ncbi:MAG: DinB family protein, partial [Planctomycetota bacterium]|nr:DinB family protein [Planctomycetota bacterium]
MNDADLREHLCWLIREGHAHVPFEEAFDDVPVAKRGLRPPGLPWSLWELLEHIRITQWDILEFSRDPGHASPPHPEGYWPDSPEPPSANIWNETFERILTDRDEFETLVRDPRNNLFEPFAWGDGQHLLREATLIADHNAY